MAKSNRYTGIQTTAVHGGEAPDPTTKATALPIHMSSNFIVESASGFSANDLTDDSPFLYARWGNPTVDALGRKIAALEGTEDCACFASGMAAASGIFMTFLSAGDHVIVSDVSYAGVAELARNTLTRMGVTVSTVNGTDLDAVRAAVQDNTKLIHVETPVNPIMRLTDLQAISDIAKPAGILVSCDATFSSPISTRCADFGVDLIMHSITKYIGGHGDALGGAVAGTRELISQLRAEASIHHGSVLSPFNAWLIARGATTLPLRMKAHQENAMTTATWLESHPKVTKVLYPGLPSHPQHDLAKRQMTNFSGMIAFQVGDRATGEALAERMMQQLDVIHYAVSLGHHRSLLFWMGTDELMETSFRLEGSQLDAYREFAGDGVFRFSIGLEDPHDIIADLDRVLA